LPVENTVIADIGVTETSINITVTNSFYSQSDLSSHSLRLSPLVQSMNNETSHIDTKSDYFHLRYPPASIRSDIKPGIYYGSLSKQTEIMLREIKARVAQEGLDITSLHPTALFEELTLLRYLRVHAMNVNKAIAHIQRNISYRQQIQFQELMKKSPDDILGLSLQELRQYYRHWQYGYDKFGSPVIYLQYGSFYASKIKKLTTFENVLRYHVWESVSNLFSFYFLCFCNFCLSCCILRKQMPLCVESNLGSWGC
jgi:hypothetical protein